MQQDLQVLQDLQELPKIEQRIAGQTYVYHGNIRLWDGKMLKCIHNKQRSRCKHCNPTTVCRHGIIKLGCTLCRGPRICIHNKVRYYCVDCDGTSICTHRRIRSTCIECNGSQICDHLKRRSRCVQCNGCEICEHLKRRSRCNDCKEAGLYKPKKRLFKKCKTTGCKVKTTDEYKGYCFVCYVLL